LIFLKSASKSTPLPSMEDQPRCYKTNSDGDGLTWLVAAILLITLICIACRAPGVGACFSGLAVLVAVLNVAVDTPSQKWMVYGKETPIMAELQAATRPNFNGMAMQAYDDDVYLPRQAPHGVVNFSPGASADVHVPQVNSKNAIADVPNNAYVGQFKRQVPMNYGVVSPRQSSRYTHTNTPPPPRLSTENPNICLNTRQPPQGGGGGGGGGGGCARCGAPPGRCSCYASTQIECQVCGSRGGCNCANMYRCQLCSAPAGSCGCHTNTGTPCRLCGAGYGSCSCADSVPGEAIWRMPEYPVIGNDRSDSIAAVVPGLPECCQLTPKEVIRNQGLYGIKGNLSCEKLKRNSVQNARFVEPVGARYAWAAYNSYDQLHAKDQYMIPSTAVPEIHHRQYDPLPPPSAFT